MAERAVEAEDLRVLDTSRAVERSKAAGGRADLILVTAFAAGAKPDPPLAQP